MNDVFADNNPNEMRQVARSVPESPEPSLTDKTIQLNPDDDAIADYDEAIRLNPDDAITYYSRGNLKAALGRYDDAIADYDDGNPAEPWTTTQPTTTGAIRRTF